jgi:hypothetical protein
MRSSWLPPTYETFFKPFTNRVPLPGLSFIKTKCSIKLSISFRAAGSLQKKNGLLTLFQLPDLDRDLLF